LAWLRADTLQLLDHSVVALGAGILTPVARNGSMCGHHVAIVSASRVGLRHVGDQAGVVEPVEPLRGVVAGAGGEQPAQQLLTAPGGTDLVARVVLGQHSAQPGSPGGAEPVAGAQQQPAVRPGGVDLAAAAAQLLAGDPLADLGQHRNWPGGPPGAPIHCRVLVQHSAEPSWSPARSSGRRCASAGSNVRATVASAVSGHGRLAPVTTRGFAPLDRSAFAGFRFPPDVITLGVRWYLRFGLSYRDIEELLAERESRWIM